ncbi:MAG TPA: histidine kinase dimerization/phosphoacceptor domain-containing protein, partial [Gemmatimonadales bacterium]|nr:histidine kinase dimerization/phosphoacceptor domain-containing protein [Gemmatimonadales bacterium]
MSARTSVWLAWSLAALSVAMLVASVALYVLAQFAEQDLVSSDVLDDLLIFVPFLAFPVVGALIASRRPENPVGWICLAAGFFWMLIPFMETGGAYWQAAAPGSEPYLVVINTLTLWMWIPPVGLLGIYLILLFPDGKLPSRRWRPLAWLSGAVMVLASLGITLAPGPLEGHPGLRNPFGLEGHPWIGGATLVIILLLPMCILASALSLILRYRRSGAEVRQQIKWLAFAASVVGLVYLSSLVSELLFAPESLVGDAAVPLWVEVQRNMLMLSYAAVPVAVGIAVLKYRLYDIDLIINRTLVYGALTASVIGIYVLVVGYLGALFQTANDLFISLLATGLVAVLFAPLRDRLQRGVNRLMYGERDDPYAVVSRLGERLEATLAPDAVLPTITETVREALKLPYAAIALTENGALPRIAASVGKPVEKPLRLPLTYQGEPVGELLLGPRGSNEAFGPADRRLLEGLARQAGVAAYAVRLTSDLQRSRERLVTAREEERRRLRRDLHDGLGAHLAGLNVQAGTLRRLIRSDPEAADGLVVELRDELRAAIADIRRLVYDLRPPALDDLGLVAALHQLAERFGSEGEHLR